VPLCASRAQFTHIFVEIPFSQYVQIDSRRYNADVAGRRAKYWSQLVQERNVQLAAANKSAASPVPDSVGEITTE
jgi:5,10-methylene-tetrahydrofolate dehydrogenase/methenyl tetrahydrofolate cyclohydrolase